MSRPSPKHAAELADLEPADHPWSVYALVRAMEVRETRAGKPYYNVEFEDAGAVLGAKAWGESTAFDDLGDFEVGDAVKLLCDVDEYDGNRQLKLRRVRSIEDNDQDFDPATLRDPVLDRVGHLAFETLVFDIETVPAHDRRKLPTTVAEALAKNAQRKDVEADAVMGMSPFFGKVVSIAVGDGDLDDPEVSVLAVPPKGNDGTDLPDWILPMAEEELLRAFWALAAKARTVVSYNGRGFDVPFLATRSLVLDIPVKIDLLANRFALRPHLDLFDILGQRGRGPSNLDTVCWALGIESPKEQMDGSMVAPAYERGEIEKIAHYNAHDVRATASVYRKVRDGMLRYRKDW